MFWILFGLTAHTILEASSSVLMGAALANCMLGGGWQWTLSVMKGSRTWVFMAHLVP